MTAPGRDWPRGYSHRRSETSHVHPILQALQVRQARHGLRICRLLSTEPIRCSVAASQTACCRRRIHCSSTPKLHACPLGLQALHLDALQAHSCCRTLACLSARCKRPSQCCTRCRTACTPSRPPSPATGPAQSAAPSPGSARTRSCPAAAANPASSARKLPPHASPLLAMSGAFSRHCTSVCLLLTCTIHGIARRHLRSVPPARYLDLLGCSA